LSGLLANSELVDCGDVFVSQRRGCAGFAQKTFARFGPSRSDVHLDNLQGNLALERGVNGQIGHAHGAAPQLAKASVRMALNLVKSEMPIAPSYSFVREQTKARF
jgi:hypothetical protein